MQAICKSLSLTVAQTLALILTLTVAGSAAHPGTAYPVHGNWRGPKPAGGAVLDLLDAARRRHDTCTENTRNHDCGCDLAFRNDLRCRPWRAQALDRKARGAYEAIALVACVGSPEQKATKLAWLRNDHAGAVGRGREAADAGFARAMRLLGTGFANAWRGPE